MNLRVPSLLLLALLALPASIFAQDSPKPTKEEKNAPRKIEIAADADKVRAALIKREMEQDKDLGDEQANRIVFRKRTRGLQRALNGDAHYQDVFVIASEPGSSTVYATVEFCVPRREGRDDCRMQTHKTLIAQLDKLLASVKAEAEGKDK